MHLHIQTVSEFTRTLRTLLEDEFRFVHIQGEISNLRSPFSGHLYFTLKDGDAQLKAVLFKGQRKFLSDPLKDGQHVICHGRISVYEPRGDYQLIVDTIDYIGTGMLQLKFERQKQRLAAEGLFSQENKKALPVFPREIILVTSSSGAAIHDFLTICKKRKTSAIIRIYPVRVQGEGAAEEIAAAITRINNELNVDIIVLCRGGGSMEDLWSFNEECVARAIYSSRTPIITGIGHEIDFTIADFCADFRAPTPTGAAEKIIPDNIELRADLKMLHGRLFSAIKRKLETERKRIAYNRRLLGDPTLFFINRTLRLDAGHAALVQSIQNKFSDRTTLVHQLTQRLQAHAPTTKIRFQQQRLDYLQKNLGQLLESLIERKTTNFLQQVAKLDSMSPLATLARGYAIVSKNAGVGKTSTIITDSNQVEIQDLLDIRLNHGLLQCVVREKVKTSSTDSQ